MALIAQHGVNEALRRVEESIRVFVRVADPKFRQVVPMRFFNLMLSPAEAEACCADFLEEKSLRAEAARTLLRILAVVARINTELEELKRSQNSASLWKLHADFLVVLLEIARNVPEIASRVIASLQDHGGMEEEAKSISASLERLRGSCEVVVKTLSQAEAEVAAR